MAIAKRRPLTSEDAMAWVDWAPPVDIIENEKEITIKVEVPGFETKDIAVTLNKNVLTIKGERHFEKEVRKESYHRMERAYGKFCRSFSLPGTFDTAAIAAENKNGLLTLVLPKRSV